MSRLYDLERALRQIRVSVGGASRMTRRLSYIYELADAALDGRPVDPDIKSPHARAIQWKKPEFPPEQEGLYVVRRRDPQASCQVAYWSKTYGFLTNNDVVDYLSLRIPTEKK